MRGAAAKYFLEDASAQCWQAGFDGVCFFQFPHVDVKAQIASERKADFNGVRKLSMERLDKLGQFLRYRLLSILTYDRRHVFRLSIRIELQEYPP